MAKNKTLTIYNSDRYFNIHTKSKKELAEAIKVTRLNEEEVERGLEPTIKASRRYKMRDDNSYMLFNEKYNNDRLIEKVCNHGGKVLFYTDTIVPYYIFKQLSTRKDSAVIYRMRDGFSDQEIDNIALSFMGTRVIVDISVVLPTVNPYNILRNLHSVKTNVDEVHLSYPRLKEITENQKKYYFFDGEAYEMKPEYKVDFAERVRVSLSVWKMYIYILTDGDDRKAVDSNIKYLKQHKKVRMPKEVGHDEISQ